MSDLIGKAALVTGGSRGIGAAIVLALAERGAEVAFTYRTDAARAEAVLRRVRAAGRRGLAMAADSADPAAVVGAVREAAASFGRLDILVNNAGIFPYGPPEAATLEEIDRTLAVHVRAVFLATQAALEHMREDGRIISIGSSLAHRVPHAGVALYAMSKSALIGFTKGLARDLGPRGITVNTIDPGSTDTDMNPADGPSSDLQRGLSAIGRYARPEDVAAMVAHLAGEGGRFVTGASIPVDGGYAA